MCVSLLLSIILVFRLLSMRSKGRTNARMNERTDGQLFPILYTHRFARGQYNNNQAVAFMIIFLLFIEYLYLKTEECQDATLPKQ